MVADAAAEEARVLRAGTLTAIGRALYPAITEYFGKRQPGWQVELRSFGWGDSTAGLHDHAADAAFVWLPVGCRRHRDREYSSPSAYSSR